MPSNSVKWIVSIVLGLLIGRASYGVLLPLFDRLTPDAAGASADTMIAVGMAVWLVVTVIASVLLARISNLRRLIGWGCVALGVVLMVTIPATLLTVDFSAHDPAIAGARNANDANTALFFWAMIFGLPYFGGGLALAILGTVLIRKNPAARDASL